jgi:NhaP-type Na+/H+ or K+/H+ antiporter
VLTPVEIFGRFLLLCVGSVGIGIVFGLLASYLLKRMRFLTVQSIRETLFIFSFGYISYTAGELL